MRHLWGIYLKAQILTVGHLHLMGGIVVYVERNACKLSGDGSAVLEEVVRYSHQLMLLVGIVPVTALYGQTTIFAIILRESYVAVLRIYDEIAALKTEE